MRKGDKNEMKKIAKILSVIIILIVIVGCNNNSNINNNIREPLLEFEGSITEMVKRLQERGFVIHFSSESLRDNGIALIDINGVCYNHHHAVIECNIESLNKSSVQIFIRQVEAGVVFQSEFDMEGITNQFQQTQSFIGAGGRIDDGGEVIPVRFDVDFIQLQENFYMYSYFMFLNMVDICGVIVDESLTTVIHTHLHAVICSINEAAVPHRNLCGEYEMGVSEIIRSHVEGILLEDVGFDSFEETAAFLRAYFYWYVLPFFEDLIMQFH